MVSAENTARTLTKFREFWHGRVTESLVSVYTPPEYRQQADPDKLVAMACETIEKDRNSGEENVLPSFWPDFGTVTTAAMWGGRIIPATADSFIHIEPAARKIADLDQLRPCAFEESDFQRGLDLYCQACARLGFPDVFVRTPDVQGPLNTLALILDQTELMCAFFDAPDAVHLMLDRITDVLIDCVAKFCDGAGAGRVIGNIWPYICLPSDLGICITQDYMPLLGPEQYAEFELPYLKRIADAFGGVWIHCCGRYTQHLRTLRNADFKIWGLEMAYPQTLPWDAYEIFGDDIVYLVGISPDGRQDFPTLVDYARHIADRECSRARFWFCTCAGGGEDTQALKDIVYGRFGR